MIRYLLSTEPDSIISIPSKRVISKSKPIHKNTSLYPPKPERLTVRWFVLGHPNPRDRLFQLCQPKFLPHFATGKDDLHPESDGSIGWANPSPAILGYFPYRADRFLLSLLLTLDFLPAFNRIVSGRISLGFFFSGQVLPVIVALILALSIIPHYI